MMPNLQNPVIMDDREFWLIVRQALLLFVDAIEKRWQMPRTRELVKIAKTEYFIKVNEEDKVKI